MIFISGNTSDSYRRIDLGGLAHITIFNDSIGNVLNFSIDGLNTHGLVYNEGIEFRDINLDSIYIKSNVAGAPCPFRFWSYGQRKVIYDTNKVQNINQVDVPNSVNFQGGQPTYGK